MAQNKKTSKAEASIPEPPIVTTTPESTPDVDTELEYEKNQKPEVDASCIEDIPLPFTATVNVALAVLRKVPDSPLMDVRPVGTLPLGTPVTITALHAGSAQLKNGLWIKTEFLTPNPARDTP